MKTSIIMASYNHARFLPAAINSALSQTHQDIELVIILMAVPDKRYTFDVNRELTSLKHLVADYHGSPEERLVRDREHFVEYVTLADKLPPDKIEPQIKFLIETNYSIHFHTFTLQSFLTMVNYLSQECNAPLGIKACADVIQGSNEFLVVLEKELVKRNYEPSKQAKIHFRREEFMAINSKNAEVEDKYLKYWCALFCRIPYRTPGRLPPSRYGKA